MRGEAVKKTIMARVIHPIREGISFDLFAPATPAILGIRGSTPSKLEYEADNFFLELNIAKAEMTGNRQIKGFIFDATSGDEAY